MKKLILGLVLLSACLKKNPAAFCPDGVCSIPNTFCDVDGTFGGSPGSCINPTCTPGEIACRGDEALTCTATGDNFDVVSCEHGCGATGCNTCTPSTNVSCSNGQLTVCGADGHTTTTETCELGCSGIETRCTTFTPLNGLSAALDDAHREQDVNLPAGSTVDTDQGTIKNAQGVSIAVKTLTIDQPNLPSIRVFVANNFTINDTAIHGADSVAFVAHHEIDIAGRVLLNGSHSTPGPGGIATGSCFGDRGAQYSVCTAAVGAVASGGGGNATTGGLGGGGTGGSGGGQAQTSFEPLIGGCAGGVLTAIDGVSTAELGGGGGGAIELVAGSKITMTGQGIIDTSGGGGLGATNVGSTGGGSGGNAIFQAPLVSLASSTYVTSYGGGGGGCDLPGKDGLLGGKGVNSCSVYFGGNGGLEGYPPGGGCFGSACSNINSCNETPPGPRFGGGGGAEGRLHIDTRTGGLNDLSTHFAKTTTGTLSLR